MFGKLFSCEKNFDGNSRLEAIKMQKVIYSDEDDEDDEEEEEDEQDDDEDDEDDEDESTSSRLRFWRA